MNAVDIRKLTFGYNERLIFNNFNLIIRENTFTTILGRGSTGKSTLFKILSGEFKYGGKVSFFEKSVSYNLEKNYVGLISTSIYNFKGRTVRDELTRALELEERFTLSKIDDEIIKISNKVGISDILDINIRKLSVKEKLLLSFGVQIINKPKILILDNVLSLLDNEKSLIIKELLRLNRKRVTIVNITNDTEECVFGSDVIILGNKLKSFKVRNMDEDDFLINGLEVPFIISLSSKLKFYELIDNNYLNIEKLVDDLWQ